MILYDPGSLSLGFILRVTGSCLPKACLLAAPSAGLAAITNWVYYQHWQSTDFDADTKMSSIWSGFTFVLGFLVVFRTQQAYSRYWEGASLLKQLRSQWFNAISSLIAYCSPDRSKHREVEVFQHLLVRLASILHSTALQNIAAVDDNHFQMIDKTGIDEETLKYLAAHADKSQRCEIVVLWIQKLIVEKQASGVLAVAPPIVSRVFQQLATGLVNLELARRITDIPFPFPYAQMLTVLLLLHWTLCPVVAVLLTKSYMWSCTLTFLSGVALWGTNYIAVEIESPFGRDANDLNMEQMAAEMNSSLWLLLEHKTQHPPKFTFSKDEHRVFRDDTKRISEIYHSEDGESFRPGRLGSTHSLGSTASVSPQSFGSLPRSQTAMSIEGNDAEEPEKETNPAQERQLSNSFTLTSSTSPPLAPDAIAPNAEAKTVAKQTKALDQLELRESVDQAQVDRVEKLLARLIAELVELRAPQHFVERERFELPWVAGFEQTALQRQHLLLEPMSHAQTARRDPAPLEAAAPRQRNLCSSIFSCTSSTLEEAEEDSGNGSLPPRLHTGHPVTAVEGAPLLRVGNNMEHHIA